MVKVRFAPSPTGNLHIGGARTALFNWMYAKSQEGAFILRIEDTDRERSKKEFIDEILDSLQWLGLKWDEIFYQSERFGIYKENAEKLVNEGKAYHEGNAVILKMPQTQLVINDLIRGEIRFDTETIKDQVLIKSDGSPTYSFACVVDDAAMEISHVIRGEDHISNTPKQIVIYEALNFKIPKFAHLPLILGTEGGRLSKRTGATAVSDYRKMGYLPQAIVNYLMLLGWSPGGNQEIVNIIDAIKKFSIRKVNKTAAEFSLDKLNWVNAQYIKGMDTQQLAELLIPVLKESGYIDENFDRNKLESIVKLFQGRMDTLADFLEWSAFIFKETYPVDEAAEKQLITKETQRRFQLLVKALEKIELFDHDSTEEAFRNFAKTQNIQTAELVHPVRVALTGKTVGPGLFETMVVLGKKETIERLNRASRA